MPPSLKSQILETIIYKSLEQLDQTLYKLKTYNDLIVLRKTKMFPFINYSKNVWHYSQKNIQIINANHPINIIQKLYLIWRWKFIYVTGV